MRAPQQAFDTIENGGRDAIFALQRDRLFAVLTDQRDGVGVNVEATIGLRDIVRHDQIDALARTLLACLPQQVVRFGGESDEQRATSIGGRSPGAEIREDVPACD